MGKVTIINPCKAVLDPLTDQELALLQMQLTYQDEKVLFELRKHKKSQWFVNKFGYEAWSERLEELKKQSKKCLLFQEESGQYWVYSGLAEKVAKILGWTVDNRVQYPEPGRDFGGWMKKPPHDRYPYQIQAQDNLQVAKHAGVEIGTGLGKSYIILHLIKELGLRTVLMAPSRDIAKRLYEDCLEAFGPKLVGFYGDGKKKIKTITVCIAASLARVEPGSEDWRALQKAAVFVADESHQCPAATLARVCFGLMEPAPYRFFFSATQMRNDGLDLLLDGITGPIVYRMTVREGIDQGYLAKLKFVMVNTDSSATCYKDDPNEHTRTHLYYNKKVLAQAANLANMFVQVHGQQVLILVEELEQFTLLQPLLKFQAKFAHGGVSKENKDKLPEVYHDSDASQFVKEFNDEQFPILVGTSCISTGSDIKANEATIYLQGGKSEIQTMQGPCGRSTRLFTFKSGRKKTACTVVDFDVANNDVTSRHAKARRLIYDDTYGPVQEVSLG